MPDLHEYHVHFRTQPLVSVLATDRDDAQDKAIDFVTEHFGRSGEIVAIIRKSS